MMISRGISKDVLSKGKFWPCWICGLMVNANSVMCVQCGRWNHSSHAGVMVVGQGLNSILLAGIIGEPVKHEEQ